MKTIKILGAGPAGLTAAINLAKAGLKVDLFEINDRVGQRFGGDLQGLENWSLKEDVLDHLQRMGLQLNFDCHPFGKVSFSNGNKTKTFNFNRPLFYLVKRGPVQGSLDLGLQKQAEEQGVKIHFQKTLSLDQVDIVATGPNLAEIAGIVKGIVFQTKTPNTAIGLINHQSSPTGYAYLLVTKGYGCMCTVIYGQLGLVNHCFEKAKKIFSHLVDLDIQQPKRVGGVGSFSLRNVFQKDQGLYVGEAAGIQDLLAGFGIRSAITSGFLAARSIVNHQDYPTLAKAYFDRRLKASLVNRFLWERFTPLVFPLATTGIQKAKDPFAVLYPYYNFNLSQRLIYPLACWYMRRRYPQLKL